MISVNNFLVLLLASFSLSTDALPLKIKRDSPRMLHLPIRSLQQNIPDVHPVVHLQQHINRAEKRMARMLGVEQPSDEELHRRLAERMYILEARPPRAQKKRNNRIRARLESRQTGDVVAGNNFVDAAVIAQNAQASSTNKITPANQPSATNSLGLSIEANDAGYIATIQLGTPPRDFNVLVDSGSADLWVAGEDCKSDTNTSCGNHQYLGKTNSSTFVDTGIPFAVKYGSGSLKGNISMDTLKLADLVLTNHTFGVALVENSQLIKTGAAFDGIMGLGQTILSAQKHLTPVDALVQKGLIGEPIVSYFISRLADGKNNGQVTFGGLDSSKFDSNTLITLPNTSPKGFWQAPVGGASLNGEDLGFTNKSGILDTGTSLIIMPPNDAAAVHQKIPGSQQTPLGFTIPCDTTATLSLKFNGTTFDIDPRDLVQLPLDPSNTQCTSGIAGAVTSGPDTWLIGDVFLKNVYFSTNSNTNKIQLAKLSSN